jgi:hypothetical protein
MPRRAFLAVFHPPIPREFIQVSPVTDNDESHRNDVDPISTARFLRAIGAIQGRISRIFHPSARFPNEVALRTL